MTPSEFRFFLNVVVVAAAGLSVLNLAMIRKRGNRAITLALACLAFGGTVWSYANFGLATLTYVGVGAVVLLLGVDVLQRAAQKA